MRVYEIIAILFYPILMFAFLMQLGSTGGIINIEHPHLLELNSCMSYVEELESRPEPVCPEIICKDTPSGMISGLLYGILGMILYILGIVKLTHPELLEWKKKKKK